MKEDRVTLDKIAALSGALFSGMLALYVGLRSGNPLYVLTALLAFSACCLWVARGRAMTLLADRPDSPRAALAFVSLFFIFFALSIWSVYLRSNPYQRPTTFFVLTAVIAGGKGGKKFPFPPPHGPITAATNLPNPIFGASSHSSP